MRLSVPACLLVLGCSRAAPPAVEPAQEPSVADVAPLEAPPIDAGTVAPVEAPAGGAAPVAATRITTRIVDGNLVIEEVPVGPPDGGARVPESNDAGALDLAPAGDAGVTER